MRGTPGGRSGNLGSSPDPTRFILTDAASDLPRAATMQWSRSGYADERGEKWPWHASSLRLYRRHLVLGANLI